MRFIGHRADAQQLAREEGVSNALRESPASKVGRTASSISDAYRPRGERLESKILLAIDLGGTSPPRPFPKSPMPPIGMDFGGATGGATDPGAAGSSVADVGDLNGNGYEDFAIGVLRARGGAAQRRLRRLRLGHGDRGVDRPELDCSESCDGDLLLYAERSRRRPRTTRAPRPRRTPSRAPRSTSPSPA